MLRLTRLYNKKVLTLPKYSYSKSRLINNINSTVLILEPMKPLDDSPVIQKFIERNTSKNKLKNFANNMFLKYTKPFNKNIFNPPEYVTDIITGVFIGIGVGLFVAVTFIF